MVSAPSTSSPPQPTANTTPPTIVTDAELLATCSADITALKKANSLEEVITQVKSGELQRIRDKYGPGRGRKTFPRWAKMKATVNRHERIFALLHDEFDNDEARFFAFFRLPSTTSQLNGYQSIRKISGAIPRMRKQVDDERKNMQYQDLESGAFSDALWKQRWPGQNDFEVWRSMGKESYEGL